MNYDIVAKRMGKVFKIIGGVVVVSFSVAIILIFFLEAIKEEARQAKEKTQQQQTIKNLKDRVSVLEAQRKK